MATATLLCKQCNFENEPERVYCHNCGAKLDRSLLPPEATRREDPVVVQERVRKMVSPRRGMGLRGVKHLIYSLVIASVLAALLLIIKPPRNIPQLSKEAVMTAPAIMDDLATLEEAPTPVSRAFRYPEDQVNAFLQNAVRGKDSTSYGVTMKFERVYIHFHEGYCSITTEQSIMGLLIYATTNRTVKIENGALVSQVLGGSFGSLKIPAVAMVHLEGIFGPLEKLFEHDRPQLTRLQSITCREKAVDLATKPAGR